MLWQDQLIWAIALSGLVVALAWREELLTHPAAVVALLLGIATWYAGTWTTAMPLIAFFAAGSLSGRLFASRETEEEPRNAWQVLANGSAFGLLVLLQIIQPSPVWIFGAYASMAVALSDTSSSEWGKYFGGYTYNIITRKPVVPGLSGGVSLEGTLAGFGGALLIALLYGIAVTFNWTHMALLVITGFTGMLADSWIGAKWQIKYRHTNGKWYDYAGEGGQEMAGRNWMTNNMVNFLSNVIVTMLAMVVYTLCIL